MKARGKFLIGSGIILVTLVSLAYVGFTQSKTYYHTITELSTLQGSALHQRMRVSGNVRNGSIDRPRWPCGLLPRRAGQSRSGELTWAAIRYRILLRTERRRSSKAG